MGAEIIVCDRPNLIGGAGLDGGPVGGDCQPLVSELPVPVSRGLTLGELALRRSADRLAAMLGDVPAIDLLTGSGGARAVIEGRAELGDVVAVRDRCREELCARRQMFEPYP